MARLPRFNDGGTERINASTTNATGRIVAPRFVLQEQIKTNRSRRVQTSSILISFETAAFASPRRTARMPRFDDRGDERINAATTNAAGRFVAPRFVLQEQIKTRKSRQANRDQRAIVIDADLVRDGSLHIRDDERRACLASTMAAPSALTRRQRMQRDESLHLDSFSKNKSRHGRRRHRDKREPAA